MGNLHSCFFGSTRDKEEGDDTIRNGNGNGNGNDGGLNYYKAAKGLFRFIISILSRRKQNSILPIQNPIATPISNNYDHALLIQPLLEDIIVEGCASSQDKIISIPTSKNAGPILPIRKPTTGPPLPVLPRVQCHVPSSQKIVPVPNSISESKEKKKKKKKKKAVITIRSDSRVEGIRWIKHYNSRHQILVVGDGDFSFSVSLALAFDRASNIIATSLDSEAFLKKNYKKAHFNIMELRRRDCHVMHEFDATVMASHPMLGNVKFDRVIYNFPFAGFFKTLPRETQLQLHRELVSLFMKNAKEMIGEDGEIHISHKTNGFHAEWKLESIASSHRLRLIEAVKFNPLEYPGYNTKCGFGGDNNFDCYPSKTYKFGIKKASY